MTLNHLIAFCLAKEIDFDVQIVLATQPVGDDHLKIESCEKLRELNDKTIHPLPLLCLASDSVFQSGPDAPSKLTPSDN